MTIYYPDVSQFTPGASLAGAVAVCARATEGDWLNDTEYEWYLKEAGGKEVPFFAYHVVESGSTGAAQAAFCHARVGSTIPVMMDIEQAGSSQPGVANVTAFIDAFRALGGITNLAYFPHWYWQQIGSPSLAPIAQRGCYLVSSAYETYSDTGPGWDGYGGMEVKIWQYTDSGLQNGVTCDMNAFKGTQAELVALFGAKAAPAPAPTPAEPVITSGATGAAVKTAQGRLNAWGAHLTVDGDFGPLTLAATRTFQGGQGLTADGIIGPLTWAKLNAVPPAAKAAAARGYDPAAEQARRTS